MSEKKEVRVGWPVFTDTIIDEVVVESEVASQFIGCKIGRVVLHSLESTVKRDENEG